MRKLKGLWKLLFGRTTILILLLLLQIGVLVIGFGLLQAYVVVFNYIIGCLSLIVLLYIINAKQNNSFKITWIMLIMAAPFVGVIFYIFTRLQPGTSFIRKRIDVLIDSQEPYLKQDGDVLEALQMQSRENAGLAAYIHGSGKYPTYKNAQLKYFPLGEDKFKEMLIQLEKAERFIFLEYFIIERGYMWDRILEILKRKAKAGVEVRLLYDGTCSLSLLPPNYPKTMEKAGIQCKTFAPIRPFLSTYQNNRDHRKILVIDGHTAFTGGVNLADEYINRVERFGHWKDTAVMVKGEAVKSFTLMFLQMWDIMEIEHPTPIENYIATDFPEDQELAAKGFVIPYGDSPYDDEDVGERVYIDILYNAKEYVHIMTPYLILDADMLTALSYAVKRGVKVIIIMPHIPDKQYAYLLARTHYADLIQSGVEIYEYTPGFIHAKVFTSDDEKAVVGTINMDFRSLYLHFECAAYIYDNPVVHDVEADFQQTLKQCQKITLQQCREYNLFKKAAGRILRLVAPLM